MGVLQPGDPVVSSTGAPDLPEDFPSIPRRGNFVHKDRNRSRSRPPKYVQVAAPKAWTEVKEEVRIIADSGYQGNHVAAGLCCIQLFMNSTTQEAIRHLEHAKEAKSCWSSW